MSNFVSVQMVGTGIETVTKTDTGIGIRTDNEIINEFEKEIIEKIIYGKKLQFSYINVDKLIKILDSMNFPRENLTYLDVLKYNINKIIDELVNFFPDIKINKFINSPCINECKIKQEQNTYKYDIYLVLTKDDKIYEYGFDFILELDENKYANKYIHSKTLLDNYEYFAEEDIQTNDDIIYYLNNVLFRLLISICALKDDEYQLAEIMYVKSNSENKSQKQILKELGYFLKIINWKKSNSIDLVDLFDELMFTDNKTSDTITFKKFTKTLNLICEKNEIKYKYNNNNNSKNNIITFDIFEEIILNINEYYSSQTMSQYKLVYKKALNMLIESLKIIIQMIKEINMKKKFTPDYINNLIMFHLNEYIDQNSINNIYFDKINKKKILFENIFNDIKKYQSINKHDEDKLDKIKNDFDLLYDDIYNI